MLWKKIGVIETNVKTELKIEGEGKTTYKFSVSVNAFSVEFPLACYQQAGRVWYVSGALWRTYMLFYPAPFLARLNGDILCLIKAS